MLPLQLLPNIILNLTFNDGHITLWDHSIGKTFVGSAAPYRRNLTSWLEAHLNFEEIADELRP